MWSRLLLKKPIEVINAEERTGSLPRQLSLFDLLCIGIGGTVGTGIFATAADIIRGTVGPGAFVSWIVAGIACCLSGFAFMELSSRISTSGSSYAYAYHAVGEFPAVLAAWLLTLEYAVSGAGVARSWSEKVMTWIDNPHLEWIVKDHCNLLAAGLHGMVVLILLFGLRFGKRVINGVTVLKIIIVLFMIVGGFTALSPENFVPLFPDPEQQQVSVMNQNPEHNSTTLPIERVMRGATQAFFGYVGFDEVSCLAAEAIDPRKTLPRAVVGVVLGTCVLSALASIALAGLQPYDDITGFASAFDAVGYGWAKPIVYLGEIGCMPIGVLIAFLAQPRLLYAMAIDGMLPPVFAQVDASGNLFWNTLLSGTFFTLVALVVPFKDLWELVDFGILASFSLTNAALVMSRMSSSSSTSTAATAEPRCAGPRHLALFVLASGLAMFLWQKGYMERQSDFCAGMSLACAIWSIVQLVLVSRHVSPTPTTSDDLTFHAPFVPYLPGLAIVVNWYLMSMIDDQALLLALAWLTMATCSYFCYGYRHSVGSNTAWTEVLTQDLEFTLEHSTPKKNGNIGSSETSGVHRTSCEKQLSINEVRPGPSWMYGGTMDNEPQFRKARSLSMGHIY